MHTRGHVDIIDRLGDLYQQARLHRRRMHRKAAEAVTLGTVPAVRAALARYRTAVAWEERCYRRYLRAVFGAFADDPTTPAPRAAQSRDPSATPPRPDGGYASVPEDFWQEAHPWI